MAILEICVDSLESAQAADLGGAERIELCSSLSEGGLTPSLGLVRAVQQKTNLQVYVMIRPRPNDFIYSTADLEIMRFDIEQIKTTGVAGVVFGLLDSRHQIDIEGTAELVELARPLKVTFHRAFDYVADSQRSLEQLISMGMDRVLTSGGKQTAQLGADNLRALVAQADGRIAILAGGGVRPENAKQLAQYTGVQEFHSALRSKESQAEPADEMDTRYCAISVEDVKALREALQSTQPE